MYFISDAESVPFVLLREENYSLTLTCTSGFLCHALCFNVLGYTQSWWHLSIVVVTTLNYYFVFVEQHKLHIHNSADRSALV